MTTKDFLKVSIVLGALAGPLGAAACGGADTKTHFGGVIDIDQGAGTFTILDLQSGSPVSFTADAEVLSGLDGLKGVIQVDFVEQDGTTLRATGIRQ